MREYKVKSADFSECKQYRYLLTRQWDNTKPTAMCIGLNPSNAGGEKDDPTINILVRTLENLGYGELKMCNLYAFIASKPSKLFSVPDTLGMNDVWLKTTAAGVQDVVFCWGDFKGIEYRAKKIKAMFPDAKCFSKNRTGTPLHPMAIMWQGLTIENLIKF